MRSRCKANATKQRGYVLMAILFMLALLTIALVAAAPAIARRIQRERELETIQRGKQYARAIRLFYRKFGRYPNTIKDLVETNNLRFLRKEYKDPESDSGEWRLIHPGESQFKPTGFFGKSLVPAGSSPLNATPIGGAAVSTTSPGNQQQTGQNSGVQPQDNSASQPQDADKAFGTSSGSNPTFGGGPIVGVAPLYKQQSLIVYNGKDHYNDWEFVYDPRMEQVAAPPGMQVAPGANGTVQQPTPNPNPGMMNQVPH